MSRTVTTMDCFQNRERQRARHLQRGGVWTIGGRSAGMAIVLATYVFLARVMPTPEFAAYVLASTIAVFFSTLAMFGLNTLVCRYVSESLAIGDGNRARSALGMTAFWGSISIGVIASFVWILLSALGYSTLRNPAVAENAGLIALWIVMLAISQILAETFRGLHNLRLASILFGVSGGLVANAILLAGIIASSYFMAIDLTVIVCLAIASTAVPAILAAVHLISNWPLSTDVGDQVPHQLQPLTTTGVFVECLPVMLVQVLSYGLAQLDIWIVAAYCSYGELAAYAVARRLALLVIIPLNQVSLVVASSLAELHARDDQASLQRVVRGAATVGALAAVIPAVLLVLFPTTIVHLTFGTGFSSSVRPMLTMILGQLVFAVTGPCGTLLMMTGRQRVCLISFLMSSLVFLVAPWAARAFGLEAVALIFAVSTSIRSLSQWFFAQWSLGINTHPCFSTRYLKHLLAALEWPSIIWATEPRLADTHESAGSPRGCEKMGLAPSQLLYSPAFSGRCEVPVPILSQPPSDQRTVLGPEQVAICKRSDTLVCIPCCNSEDTIGEVVAALLVHSEADILLVDDTSKLPLRDFIARDFPNDLGRITVLRPASKLYTGGSKNIGIRTALRQGYRLIVLMDSDIVCGPTFVGTINEFFEQNPEQVVVSPGILPHGSWTQYADTLINFSKYLPEPTAAVTRKSCLAGYAFALNLKVFARSPCFMANRIGGDDVLFFRQLLANFQLESLPLLNQSAVVHKPPRRRLSSARRTQLRYAQSFFTHNDERYIRWFNRLPLLHLLTPRFVLMVLRLFKRRRIQDVVYLPLCWYLDFTRAIRIVQLSFSGYRDPENTFWNSVDTRKNGPNAPSTTECRTQSLR